MINGATRVVAMALVLAVALALPAPPQDTHPAKRATQDQDAQGLANFRDILKIANLYRELEEAALRKAIESRIQEEEEEEGGEKKKRMFAPLSGLPGEVSTIKRQIRYHQCYFNPISCFRRK